MYFCFNRAFLAYILISSFLSGCSTNDANPADLRAKENVASQGQAEKKYNNLDSDDRVDSTGVSSISVDQWRNILRSGEGDKTTDWIALLSSDIADQAVKKFGENDRGQGLELALQSTVLTDYYLWFYRASNSENIITLKNSQPGQRNNLAQAGVSERIFDESLNNLKIALPFEQVIVSAIKEPKRLKVRKASGQEVMAISRAVRLRLVDPDSARFGDYIMIEDESACVMVNARNRMGGYNGLAAVYLERVDGVWHYIKDIGAMETCLLVVKKMKS